MMSLGTIRKFTRLAVSAVAALLIGVFAVPALADHDPDDTRGSISWTGHGAAGGVLDSEVCVGIDGNATVGFMLWIFTLGGEANTVTEAELFIDGESHGLGIRTGHNMRWTTDFFAPDPDALSAHVHFEGELGVGEAVLTISHGCPSEEEAVAGADEPTTTTTTTAENTTTTTEAVAGPDEPTTTTTAPPVDDAAEAELVLGPDEPELPFTGVGHLLTALVGGLGLMLLGSASLVAARIRRGGWGSA